MDLGSLLSDSGLSRLGLMAALGLPRLAGALSVNPITAGGALSGQARAGVAGAMALLPAPILWEQLGDLAGAPWSLYALLAAKEALLGLAIGWVSGLVFWAVQSAGLLMDNQRGASSASGLDPLSGEETSPLGSLLFQGVAVAFFVGGGFTAFLRLLWSSYALWPATALLPSHEFAPAALFFASLADWVMLQTVLLAGPVLAACLLADVSLGIVNRFAAQLNVYILAMPIKSGLTALILVGYYGALAGLGPGLFEAMRVQIFQAFGLR